MEPPDYCREIEAYLCRKNEGHLIRIVGPAFEQVCGWAMQGVPLKVAFRGIDQYCERYYAKGPRRRPVRIEFCEADILDLFDAWRRAIGVPPPDAGAGHEPAPRTPPLAAHIERAVARLTSLRAGESRSAAFGDRIDAVVRQLDHVAADSRRARGETRVRILEELRRLDEELLQVAAAEASADLMATVRREAELELAPFVGRMRGEELDRAKAAAVDRLLRESLGLPVLSLE